MALDISLPQARFFQCANDVIDRCFSSEDGAVLKTGLPYLEQAPGLQEWIQARAEGMQTIFRANQAHVRITQELQKQDQCVQAAWQELQNANQHRDGVDQEQVQAEEEFAQTRGHLQNRLTVVQNRVQKEKEFILFSVKHPFTTEVGRNILKLGCFIQNGLNRLSSIADKVMGVVRDRPALGWTASISSILSGLYAFGITPNFEVPVTRSLFEMNPRAVAMGALRAMPARAHGLTSQQIMMSEWLARAFINQPGFQALANRVLVEERYRETTAAMATKGNIAVEMTAVIKIISAIGVSLGVGKVISLACQKAKTIFELQEELVTLNGEIAQASETRAKRVEEFTQRRLELSEQIQKGSQAIECAQKQRQELESQKAKVDTVISNIQRQITGDILGRSIGQVRSIVALNLDENTKRALIASSMMTVFDAVFLSAVHQNEALAGIAQSQDFLPLAGPDED